MRALCPIAPALCLILPLTAAAQYEDDAPIPYPDEVDERPTDARGLRQLPEHSDHATDLRDAAEWEGEEDVQLSRLDDPNLGLGGELLMGVLLVEGSRGNAVEPSFAWGLRFNWEVGRLIAREPFTEALFADLTWAHGALRGGTERIFADTHYHYVTLAPAWELQVDEANAFGFYAQIGAGLAYQNAWLHADGADHAIAGIKPVVQYGLGFRGRPLVHAASGARIAFRIELTRLRRGYMDDTLLGATVGTSF